MDAKSLAKSKRAHSQHHSKKHHPNQLKKGPSSSSVGASSSNKPLDKEVKAKSRPPPASSSLPSNWDRYQEESDLGTEDASQDGINQPTDIVLPKSKGADYAYLISEAKSQYQTSCSAEIFPSLRDVVQDFDQGMGSLLSVRGQSILSLIEGDNFIVEDKATASNEASFFSLDLHALAEQLQKVDLSKRLFIEEDELPLELFPEELHASHNSHQNQSGSEIKVAKKDSDELPTDAVSHKSSEARVSSYQAQGFTEEQLKPIDQVKEEHGKSSRPGQRTGLNSSAEPLVGHDPKKKPSGFEAAAAEAELDMLLGSFSETNLLDSPGTIESVRGQTSDEYIPALPGKKFPDLYKSALAADLDDTLDDLLDQTSLVNQSVPSSSQKGKASLSDLLSSPSSHLASKAKVLDDFDSWLDTI